MVDPPPYKDVALSLGGLQESRGGHQESWGGTDPPTPSGCALDQKNFPKSYSYIYYVQF